MTDEYRERLRNACFEKAKSYNTAKEFRSNDFGWYRFAKEQGYLYEMDWLYSPIKKR